MTDSNYKSKYTQQLQGLRASKSGIVNSKLRALKRYLHRQADDESHYPENNKVFKKLRNDVALDKLPLSATTHSRVAEIVYQRLSRPLKAIAGHPPSIS